MDGVSILVFSTSDHWITVSNQSVLHNTSSLLELFNSHKMPEGEREKDDT